MKWNKEIIAIITSLLLLAALVVNWGYNVYQNKITALQAESNIIFFEALETAKERMFLRKAFRPRLVSTTSNARTVWGEGGDYFLLDSTLQFENDHTQDGSADNYNHSKFPNNLIQKELASWADHNDSLAVHVDTKDALKVIFEKAFVGLEDSLSDGIKISNLSIKMTDDGGEVHMNSDTIIIVDFDTTQTYLEKVFLAKMDTAALSQLKIKVYDAEDLDAQEVKASFITNRGKLGDVFFGRKTYAATVQNFAPIALKKMIPEMLFGLFLYGLIAAAFFVIYKSLLAQRKLVKVKDEFVGNITHELKTPISVVNVAIEAIQNFDADKDPEKTNRYLDISKKELSRLSGLVDKVLHLAVNPSDDAPTELVDITELTSQVVDAMRVRLNELPITLQLDAIDDTLLLDANISQVKSVIYNLIDNAIKYSDKGNVLVSIHKKNRRFMEIKVADQGIGISKAFQDKIFDQFFRVPSDNVHNVKGYGLGLHNVKQIVERYNGSITLKSEEGIGTVFTIKWPITNG